MTSRVALITGAASGIGAEAARQLERRGFRLALLDVDGEAVARVAGEVGAQAEGIRADVSIPSELKQAVQRTVERFGGIDAVVVNAGIQRVAPIATIEPGDFERIIQVNLVGAWHTVRATLSEVVSRRGYFLFVSSLAGLLPPPLNAPYAASKAGMQALAATLRLEVQAAGVAVGIVYLGYIGTDAGRRAVEDPLMAKLAARMPRRGFIPIPVEEAAGAIVNAIEQRSRRAVVARQRMPGLFVPDRIQAMFERWARRRGLSAIIRDETSRSGG